MLEKVEVLNYFFASVFTKCSSHSYSIAEDEVRVWENEEPPTEGEYQAWGHLSNLKVHKTMRSDEMQKSRELSEEVALSIYIWEVVAVQ